MRKKPTMAQPKSRPPRLQMILEEGNRILTGIADYDEANDAWRCILRSGRRVLDERYSTDAYAELADMIQAFRGLDIEAA